MTLSWFHRLVPSKIRTEASSKSAVPEGLWSKCPSCNAILYKAEVERNLEVCPKCGYHMRISGRKRLHWFLDPGNRLEIGENLISVDPLKFKDSKKYKDRLAQCAEIHWRKGCSGGDAGCGARSAPRGSCVRV